ncbi:unnamed protein product [Durusdinium trenchii]|uniref:Uncharacterized protein n=1 Tax=Durusdinium trenchii TaxID=1381693 RepID=A0ABP0NZP1_9DINO
MENGFALDAYHVPKCGAEGPVHGGTMPKASNEAGSLFTEVKKNAKLPGPDYYNKEGKPFGQKAPLGQFSRIARDDHNSKKNWPAVGQYETITPVCTPRTRGGIMAKSARGCLIYDQAVMEGKWKPAPGKCADGINGTGAGGIGGWTRGAENECDGFLVRLILLVKESS